MYNVISCYVLLPVVNLLPTADDRITSSIRMSVVIRSPEMSTGGPVFFVTKRF